MRLKRKAHDLSTSAPGAEPIGALAVARAYRTHSGGIFLDDGHDSENSELAPAEFLAPTLFRSRTPSIASESDHTVSSGKDDRGKSGSNVLFSTWTASGTNIFDSEKGIELILNALETVAFLGEYILEVRSGIVTVYGASLKSSNCRYQIIAPSTHPIPLIRCAAGGGARIFVGPTTSPMRILANISPHFRGMWSPFVDIQKDSTLRNISFCVVSLNLICVMLPTVAMTTGSSNGTMEQPLHALIIPEQWQNLIQSQFSLSGYGIMKVLVSGSKNVGKSTFCRVLINHLLSPSPSEGSCTVLLLDLDPGQPEFGAPGQVSLVQITQPIFGPSFGHAYVDASTSNRVIAAHSIGATSPIEDLEHYLACCVDLQSRCNTLQHEKANIALVINCPGWSGRQQFGQELARVLTSKVHATDVVIIGNNRASKSAESLSVADCSNRVHHIHPALQFRPSTSRNSADLRGMQTISYFHSKENEHTGTHWVPQPLKHLPLWQLRYDGTRSEIVGILTQHQHIKNPDRLISVLDGWIVGVCFLESDDEVILAASAVQKTENERLPYWPLETAEPTYRPSASNSTNLGWAFVANIDVEARTIGLVTPLAESVKQASLLKGPNGLPRIVLTRGATDTPGWAYLEDSHYNASERRARQAIAKGEIPEEGSSVEPGLEVDGIEILFDIAAMETNCERDYTRRTRRGEVLGVGGKHWTLRPRIAKK